MKSTKPAAPRTVYRSVQVKLYLTPKQQELLKQQLGIARWVYNRFLALRVRHHRMFGKRPGYIRLSVARQSAFLKKLKQNQRRAWLNDGCSWAMQHKLSDLESGFIGFWRDGRGFPKFKRRNRAQTMQYGLIGGFQVKAGDIRLPKLGRVKYKGQLLRGKVVNATIKRHIFARVDLTILYEVPQEELVPNGTIAIDINCHNITDNNGNRYDLPAYCFDKEIRHWQKKVSRSQKGSNRRFKAVQMYAKWHDKAVRKRRHYAHMISSKIAARRENQARRVIIEDINLQHLSRRGKHKRGLNRSLLDSCLGEIRRQLEYKAAEVRRLDKFFPSSKLCSDCGHKNTGLTLSERVWQCPSCGAAHDRDVNAAVNLYKKWAENARRGDGVRPDAWYRDMFRNTDRPASVCEARSS